MPNATLHPTPQELNAFTLGKLDDAGAATVARHLETCSACRQVIEKLPGDSFVGKVRAAKPSVSALPARPGEAAKTPPLPPKDLPPDLANYSKYRFVRELGRGGMGVVYQAEQTVMGRSVAVKVINPSVLDHPDALPRFQSEVRAAAKLDHPNIVRAHDAEQVGNMHLLVMEYIEGASLADLVAKKGPLSVPYACHYIRQAALGLQHAFEQGMVHRDIKPQNLMVNARGQLKVLDFGLARMKTERKAGRGLTQVDAFMGTPEYVSPEQATDAHNADTRADIYSLGCTLFFLLAGRPPFQSDTAVKLIMAHIEKEAPALHAVCPEVPLALSAVVARMLAKDPACRFQTPVEVAQALAAFVKPGTKQASAVSSPAAGVSSPGTGTMLSADTSKIKAILGDVPRKAPALDVPTKDAVGSVSAGIGEPVASAKNKEKPARKSAEPVAASVQPSSRKKWLLGGGIGVGVLLLALFGMWAGGMFGGKVEVKTKDGILVIEVNEPNPVVLVDGEKVTVTWHNGGKKAEIGVKPGTHKVEVKKDGFSVEGKELTFNDGGKEVFTARLLPKIPPQPPIDGNKDKDRPLDSEEKWVREVRALSAEKQIEAVKDKLKERNPDVEGEWAQAPGIEDDTIVSLAIRGSMSDLSPLRALSKLRSLSLFDSGLADLTPLQGLPLSYLNIVGSAVADLSPLSGMKELEYLHIVIAPLTDLRPLKGLKLRELTLHATRVEDLSPLMGMPLKLLNIHRTQVKDLSPLKGMKLEVFVYWDQPVEDISVLKDMPLREVGCDFQRERDEAVLRSIETLETINRKPVAEFWKEVDGTNTSGGSVTKTPRSDYDDLAKGRWVAVLPSVEEFKRLQTEKAYSAEKVHRGTEPTFVDGVLELKAGRMAFPSIKAKDAIVRARVKKMGPKYQGNVTLALRRTNNGESVAAWFNGGGDFGIGGFKNHSWKDFTWRRLSEQYDDYFELAFAAVGHRLIVYVNGRKILEARDDTPLDGPGTAGVGAHVNSGLFRDIEIQVLDTPSAPEEKGPAAEKDFVQLFNGKDLKGWRTHPKQPGKWHVANGVLIGSGPATSHLYSIRRYTNFHLRVEARINDGGNSGVYFRAPFGPIRPVNNPMFPQGYEAQINATHGDPRKTGSLLGFNQITVAPHKPNEWFTMDVIAEGNHIVIKVNGRVTADYPDDKRLYTSGHFILQQADAATVVEFRKIEIKELPAKKP